MRRSWKMDSVAKGFGMNAYNISDGPDEMKKHLQDGNVFEAPLLLNINTIRKYWHAGAGIDDPDVFDRYQHEMITLGEDAEKIHQDTKLCLENIWQQQLDKQ